MISFAEKIKQYAIDLSRKPIEMIQVNIGKLCNQACKHCHVESGPDKTEENMDLKTVEKLLDLIQNTPNAHTVDITGGAPELNPHFRYFVTEIKKMGKEVIDRCNLTVLYEPGQEDTAQFLADNRIQIVASLPCYSKENVEKQRGRGVFGKSIDALQHLNKLGYGQDLTLNLVYNPLGTSLPPAQDKLESDYKKELNQLFNITFNNLYTITNMPIKRFLVDLQRQGKLDEYMQLLLDNFNPAAAEGVMCRNLVSVSWDGFIYDCDFNQMLDIPLAGTTTSIWGIDSFTQLESQKIALADHCYGCTAGAGSSCGGATT